MQCDLLWYDVDPESHYARWWLYHIPQIVSIKDSVWTNDGLAYWHINAPLGLIELTVPDMVENWSVSFRPVICVIWPSHFLFNFMISHLSKQLMGNSCLFSLGINMLHRRSKVSVQAAYGNISTVAHKTWLISNNWMTIMVHGYTLLKITYLGTFSINVCFYELMLRITNDQSNHRH